MQMDGAEPDIPSLKSFFLRSLWVYLYHFIKETSHRSISNFHRIRYSTLKIPEGSRVYAANTHTIKKTKKQVWIL